MSFVERAQQSLSLHNWTREQLSRLSFVGGERRRTSAAFFAVAHAHHQGILSLLLSTPPLVASAYALVRPQFESYLRGMWILRCATDHQLESFSCGNNPPSAASMIRALASDGEFETLHLEENFKRHWRFMCSYTHSGAQQVSRWWNGSSIEPNYSNAEIIEVLEFSEMFSVFTGIGVAMLAEDKKAARAIADRSLEGRPVVQRASPE